MIPLRASLGFLIATFSITWVVIGAYVIAPDRMSAVFGPISGSHPLFFLATWAPAISGVAVVLYFGGLDGLKGLLARLLYWRIPSLWAGLVIVALPLVFMAGSLIKGGPLLAPSPGVGALVAGLFMMLFLGPVEEIGWRGVLQPLLQRRLVPAVAGAVIGALWGLWHLPAFFLAGTVFGGWNFAPFFIGNVALGVLVTPLLNRSGGGLFWPVLFHWQLINPLWPDAQPWDTWILVAAAVIVVVWDRDAMLTRRNAVTDVWTPKATR